MARTPKAPRVRVTVDAATIHESLSRDSSHCMIAEAVRAAYPAAASVAIDIQTIRFSDRKKGLRFTYLTPRIAQVPLIKFDQGIKPEPFEFTLRNGQVTRAGSSQVRLGKRMSEKQRQQHQTASKKGGEAAKKALEVSREGLKRARLVNRGGTAGTVPDKVGGKTPPLAPFSRRRAFGLRGLEV